MMHMLCWRHRHRATVLPNRPAAAAVAQQHRHNKALTPTHRRDHSCPSHPAAEGRGRACSAMTIAVDKEGRNRGGSTRNRARGRTHEARRVLWRPRCLLTDTPLVNTIGVRPPARSDRRDHPVVSRTSHRSTSVPFRLPHDTPTPRPTVCRHTRCRHLAPSATCL